jgi:hypothetical protein
LCLPYHTATFIGLSIGGLDPSWHREHQDPETFCCRSVAVCIFGHEIRLGPWPWSLHATETSGARRSTGIVS